MINGWKNNIIFLISVPMPWLKFYQDHHPCEGKKWKDKKSCKLQNFFFVDLKKRSEKRERKKNNQILDISVSVVETALLDVQDEN